MKQLKRAFSQAIENFCKNIQTIHREAAEKKNKQKLKEDLLPEETLYENLFPVKIQLYLKHGIVHHGKTS